MKTTCTAVLCILTFLHSACVTGDEITSYVIDPDGGIAFSIYRLNLTSSETGEDAKKELANYMRDLEEKRGGLFANLAKADAREVKVAVVRRSAPGSVLLTGRIPSLNDFAAYISEEDENSILACTAISSQRTRGFLFVLTRKPSNEKAQPAPAKMRADSLDETRFALAEGSFTKAQGFLLAHDRRSALLDTDALLKMWNFQIPSITLSLEWQLPEAR